MEVLHPRCAGLDVHSRQVTACVRVAAGSTVTTEHREFATTTAGLFELSAWLTEAGCTHVAMEATGVYWKPVWHILEDEESLTLVLANARHIRNVPGRKSDQKDAAWIADLLAHGLIRGSFVPPAPIQELRDLTRTRKQLVAEIARHTQRLQKTLEDANVKLTRVVTDILGASSRAVLAALIAGETDPERLADCTTGRLKAGRADIVAAVHGRVTAHHRFLLELHLAQIDALSATVQKVERQADKVLRPFREAADRLTTIPGVSETVARVIISEVGTDMTQFPTAGHLVWWAGLCPRLDESAGKRRSTRLRHATPWLKTELVQAAWPLRSAAATSRGAPAREPVVVSLPSRRCSCRAGTSRSRPASTSRAAIGNGRLWGIHLTGVRGVTGATERPARVVSGLEVVVAREPMRYRGLIAAGQPRQHPASTPTRGCAPAEARVSFSGPPRRARRRATPVKWIPPDGRFSAAH